MSKIGDFELLEPLRGGTHPLYKAKDSKGNVVALKAISVDGTSEEQRARFLREAEIAASLDHPNLLKLITSGSTDDHLYQVMELLEGSDLDKLLAKKTSFTWEQRIRIMAQVCDGLGYAHARGLVHRDLKPANLFLEDSGRIRILDFGMARILNSNLTKVGVALGTLNYMSPEQIRADQITSASDVFSCGIIFYQLISGEHPFSHGCKQLQEIFTKMLFEAPRPLRELVPDVPAAIEDVINQALNKDPEQRPQNGSELRGMLRSAVVGSGVGSPAAKAVAATPAQNVTRPDDYEATRVLRRPDSMPAPPKPAPLPAEKVPPPAVRAQAPPQVEQVYCPACAMANTKGATICKFCGVSLMTTAKYGVPQQQKKTLPIAWIVAGAVSLVTIVVLVLLLIR